MIAGGGMGGIAAAQTLAKTPLEITLVDSRNYLFQPLLYEVAGAIVNTEDVTHAIRGLLRGQQTRTSGSLQPSPSTSIGRRSRSTTATGSRTST